MLLSRIYPAVFFLHSFLFLLLFQCSDNFPFCLFVARILISSNILVPLFFFLSLLVVYYSDVLFFRLSRLFLCSSSLRLGDLYPGSAVEIVLVPYSCSRTCSLNLKD